MGSILEKAQLIKAESARMGEFLKRLSSEAWSTQSACDAWQVRDVIAHLAGGVDRFAPNILRGARGDGSAPEGASPAGVGDMDARLRANAQVAIDFRESLGDDLVKQFNENCAKLDDALAELEEADSDKPCYHPAGTISVETYLNLRLTELIVHEWDCRSRLEAAPVMSAEALPSILEILPVFVVGRLFDPGVNITSPTRFRFELTGVAAESYDIVAGGGQKAIMELASDKRPDAIIGCDTQTFVLLVYGRVTLEDQIAAGNVFVSRDTTGVTAQFGKEVSV